MQISSWFGLEDPLRAALVSKGCNRPTIHFNVSKLPDFVIAKQRKRGRDWREGVRLKKTTDDMNCFRLARQNATEIRNCCKRLSTEKKFAPLFVE